jgi:hypothetical protein
MEKSSEVTMFDFQKLLTPDNLKVLQIIFAAMAMGVVFFTGYEF